jgi:hypothetical protein
MRIFIGPMQINISYYNVYDKHCDKATVQQLCKFRPITAVCVHTRVHTRTHTTRTIVHDRYLRLLVTRKTLSWGHVAFDTSGLFRKIAVRLDSPYLQQIAFIRTMPTYAIACRTSIRRFKRATRLPAHRAVEFRTD